MVCPRLQDVKVPEQFDKHSALDRYWEQCSEDPSHTTKCILFLTLKKEAK